LGKNLVRFRRFRKINILRFIKMRFIARLFVKKRLRYFRRMRRSNVLRLKKRFSRFLMKYKIFFYKKKKKKIIARWGLILYLLKRFSLFRRSFNSRLRLKLIFKKILREMFFHNHFKRLRYRRRWKKKRIFKKQILLLLKKRIYNKYIHNRYLRTYNRYKRKVSRLLFINLKFFKCKKLLIKYYKRLHFWQMFRIKKPLKFYKLRKFNRSLHGLSMTGSFFFFNFTFVKGFLINDFLYLRVNYLSSLFKPLFIRKLYKFLLFRNFFLFNENLNIWSIFQNYFRLVNFNFYNLQKKLVRIRLKKNFYNSYFILRRQYKKLKSKRLKNLLIKRFRVKRFSIRGFFHFPRRKSLHRLYVKKRHYFRCLRKKRKLLLKRLNLNNIRNNIFYMFNILKKKVFKLFIFIGSVLNCFYNSTYKQYNYILNLSFKNLVFIPFFSVINLVRVQFARVLIQNKLMIDLFFQVFEFSKLWFQKLKGIRRRQRNGYRIRKRAFFSSRYIYATKKKRSNKFIKNFKSRRPRSLRFIYLRNYSNKFVLRNSILVHRFFLRFYEFRHLVFAWKNFYENFIWTNRNVNRFLRIKKIRNLSFYNQMHLFTSIITLEQVVEFQSLNYLRLKYYWYYFIIQKHKFTKKFLFVFFFLRFILKLSIKVLCLNLIS
jgi:hypothetical protein